MSLNEYNKHSMLGPLAGPATTAASIAGQEAYKQAHEQPVYAGGNDKPLTVSGVMWTLAALASVAAIGAAGAFLLPESLATIAGFVALMAVIGFVIVGIFSGIEAVKFAIGWMTSSAVEHGWWRIVAVALAAFVFAAFYSLAFDAVEAWMVALFAAALAIAARLVPGLRPVCAAIGSGIVAYILAASHLFERYSLSAVLIGALAAAAIFGAGYAWQTARRRKPA